MKTNSRMIVFLMTMVSTTVVYGQANLLPNGDFSDAEGVQGWTISGSETGGGFDQSFDAENFATSGSISLFPSVGTTPATATSTCFSVKPSANFTFGGKVSNNEDGMFIDTTGEMNCKSFSDGACTTGASDLGTTFNLDPFASSTNSAFTTFIPAKGTLNASASTAQCTLAAVNGTGLVTLPGPIEFDDLYFELPSSTSTAVNLGGYLSGSWYDPTQSGQGFQLEFTAQRNVVTAMWYTYSPDGKSTQWVYGGGAWDPTQSTLTIPAVLTSGAAFPPNFVGSDVEKTPWGTLTFAFTDCNNATLTWSSTLPGYGSGTEQLKRLTSIAGLSCPQ
jgi:hypothetical protein